MLMSLSGSLTMANSLAAAGLVLDKRLVGNDVHGVHRKAVVLAVRQTGLVRIGASAGTSSHHILPRHQLAAEAVGRPGW